MEVWGEDENFGLLGAQGHGPCGTPQTRSWLEGSWTPGVALAPLSELLKDFLPCRPPLPAEDIAHPRPLNVAPQGSSFPWGGFLRGPS